MRRAFVHSGSVSRLLERDGRQWVYPAWAAGWFIEATNCCAGPSSTLHGTLNLNAGTLNFAVVPQDWQTHWIRLLLEFALLIFASGLLWRFLRNRKLHTRERTLERQSAMKRLAQEKSRRLIAERKSRTLSQRLLTAHEEERSRLARELHDDLTQRLARLAIDAAQAERGAPGFSGNGAWRGIREELVRLSEDVHSLAYRLHPSLLDELGLVAALSAECDHFSQRERIAVNVTSRDVPRELSGGEALCLFRICQESLNNVARHAQARAVEVQLAAVDGGVELSVRDNGLGFNSAQITGHASLGLASMKERAQLLAGKLDIKSKPGHGTTIVAWIPTEETGKL